MLTRPSAASQEQIKHYHRIIPALPEGPTQCWGYVGYLAVANLTDSVLLNGKYETVAGMIWAEWVFTSLECQNVLNKWLLGQFWGIRGDVDTLWNSWTSWTRKWLKRKCWMILNGSWQVNTPKENNERVSSEAVTTQTQVTGSESNWWVQVRLMLDRTITWNTSYVRPSTWPRTNSFHPSIHLSGVQSQLLTVKLPGSLTQGTVQPASSECVSAWGEGG